MSAGSNNGYPAAGDVIDGKYQIERMLGEGGMGAVARAIHLLLRAPVALKFMNPQFMTFPGAVERFLNEGIASKAIKSEHVVQVDDVGKLPSGAPYLVMDCLDGRDLSDLLAQEGKPGLEIQRAIHFVVQILRGLQVAHAIGIIHRDMKPSNCFVVKHEGLPDFVKILDFGISKVQQPGSQSLTQTNSALGTPLYMSPEQARSPRDVDARSDIYSVGVILYELISGNTPFNSESGEFTEILFKLFTADVPRIEAARPEVSPELAVVVHKALAREVADRYQSAAEFAEGLLPFAMPRTAALIDRMKHYQPDSRSSIVPRAEHGPSSALAFSALQGGSQMQSPGQGGDSGGRIAARPSGSDTAATPSEATAKTQISAPGLTPGPAPGAGQGTQMLAQGSRVPAQQSAAQTNLSASRELTDAEINAAAALPQKRSPIIFAIPVVAIVLIVGIGVAIKSMSGHATPDPGTTGLVQNATPPPSSTPLPTPSAATADTATAANDAVKDAGAVVTNTNAKPPGQTNGQTNTGQTNTGHNQHQQTQQQQNNGHSNVLDNDLAN